MDVAYSLRSIEFQFFSIFVRKTDVSPTATSSISLTENTFFAQVLLGKASSIAFFLSRRVFVQKPLLKPRSQVNRKSG